MKLEGVGWGSWTALKCLQREREGEGCPGDPMAPLNQAGPRAGCWELCCKPGAQRGAPGVWGLFLLFFSYGMMLVCSAVPPHPAGMGLAQVRAEGSSFPRRCFWDGCYFRKPIASRRKQQNPHMLLARSIRSISVSPAAFRLPRDAI